MEIPVPDDPVKIALIGCGNRARSIYQPLFPSLKPWVELVAVCDPLKNHCDEMAAALEVPPYYDIRTLVRDKPMEAGLIVVPVPGHHSLSVYLSENRIHNHCETSWCNMVCQGRQMIEAARRNEVVARVGENFFRFGIDRFAQRVKDSGYIGRIGRVFSYGDHTGYHNNSRWIRLSGSHPLWVQSLEHAMDTPSFRSLPHRFHQGENFRARFFGFADDFLVVDQAANIKGHLGRLPRPGYTEWQGERGALIYRATGTSGFSDREAELRRCSDAGLDTEHQIETIRAHADQIAPVVVETEKGIWRRSFAATEAGTIECVNPFHLQTQNDKNHPDYGVAVVDHIVDFALAVRGLRTSEFDDEDALMSLMMEAGAWQSAQHQGQRIELPLAGEVEYDDVERRRQQEEYGIDPLDVEAMLAHSYPRP